MKKILLMLFVLGASPGMTAQEWKKNLEEALREASVQNKNVLLFFSVPDACDTCVRLEKNIWESQEFKAYAKANYVLARIDFRNTPGYSLSPEAKAKNLLIVEKYNKDGFFPLVVLLNKNEHVLGKAGLYNDQTPTQYIAMLQSLEKN